MKDLKELFENNGFQNVVTYINSGNIIFSSNQTDLDGRVIFLSAPVKTFSRRAGLKWWENLFIAVLGSGMPIQ